MSVTQKQPRATGAGGGDGSAKITVSQALAKIMREYGAEHVFTLTGAPQNPLIELQNREGIRVILGRSERSAFAMADAYARLTGKPTFGIVQYGPGATYLPASIIDAYWASSPLIAISGTTNTNTRYRYEYQAVLEQTSMFPSMTKWAGDLPNRSASRMCCARRFLREVSGVPGPAYLGIPADWFNKPLNSAPDIYAEKAFLKTPAVRSAPLAADLESAIALLSKAEKPVMLAGGGVMLSNAWQRTYCAGRSVAHSGSNHDGRKRQHRRRASAFGRRGGTLLAQDRQRRAGRSGIFAWLLERN